MSTPPSSRRLLPPPISLIALALLLAGVVTVIAIPSSGEFIASAALIFGNSYAGALMVRRSRALEKREQNAWRLIGAGFTLSAVGVLAVGITDAVAGSVPAFGGYDFFFLGAYVLILSGMASLPGSGGGWRERIQRIIDAWVVSLSVATVMAVLVLGNIIEGLADAPTFDRWVGTSYPLFDTAAIVSVGILFVRRRHFGLDARLLFIAAGMMLQVIADLSYLSTAAGGSFDEASPNFAVFTAAVFCYVAAGSIVDRRPKAREVADRRAPVWSLIAPYGAAFVMFAILADFIFEEQQGGTMVLFSASLIVVSLVFLRQALAIRENRILVEQERTVLISSLSHELRTPLTSLVGFLSVLDDDGDMLTAAERIDVIATTRQQADYMGRMVTDLVMLARDDLDNIDISRNADVLVEIIERSVVSADISRAKLTVAVDPNLLVSVDSDRVQQVFVNLITNADRYGSGAITIEAHARGRDLVASVHDNGAGVPKKHQITMWDRFERAHHRFNATIPGSGIGLAIVASLVKAHHGRVTYSKSELLGGACFTVELPGVVLPYAPTAPREEPIEGPPVAVQLPTAGPALQSKS